MHTPRKFWLVVIGSIVALVLIACSCSNMIPINFGGSSGEAVPGLAGKWLDPDTTGTYHVIQWQGEQYVVTKTANPNSSSNYELKSSNWSNGVLTWTYCVQGGNCVTTQTVSVNGNNLETTWSNDQGGSGSTTMTRMP